MYRVRLWSVSQARTYRAIYQTLENVLYLLHPLLNKIGYDRLEKPVAAVERNVKGLLFDCQMCGQCALSQTGMSCPMNCPKEIRYGPCGGVRPNGNCEVKPEMRCVWVEAWRGKTILGEKDQLVRAEVPVDFRMRGTSSWLREVRERHAAEQAAKAQQAEQAQKAS